MLTFAIAAAKPGRSLPAETLATLRESSPPELAFHACDHQFWVNRTASVAIAAWQDTLDDSGTGSRWHQSNGRLIAYTGWAWPREGPWSGSEPWVECLADYLEANGGPASTADLLGVFTVASISESGAGFVVSDPLGMGLLYLGAGRDVDVISTRADVAARVHGAEFGAAPIRSGLGSGWVAFGAYPVGLSTGFESIEVVPAGDGVALDRHEGASVVNIVPPPWDVEASPDERESMIEGLRADMASTVEMARRLPVASHLSDLTGGKDSRLVLAAMLDLGVADKFEFRTMGRPDLRDAVVASEIAERFGLRHSVSVFNEAGKRWRAAREAALLAAGLGDLDRRELAMRLTVGSWSGMRNVSEPRAAAPPTGDSVLLSGLCGEALRTNFPWAVHRFKFMDELRDFPEAGLKWGQAGILLPDAREHYVREVRSALFENFEAEAGVHDAVDAFYIRNRLRRWGGMTVEVDQQNRLFPLCSYSGVRAAFAIGGPDRHSEYLHYQIITRISESLAQMPFDKDGWDQRLVRKRPSELSAKQTGGTQPSRRAPAGSQAAPVRGVARSVVRDRRSKFEATDLKIMRKFLLEEPSNPVFEFVDRTAVVVALEKFDHLNESSKRQIYGALSAAIWLGGHEIAVRADAPAPHR